MAPELPSRSLKPDHAILVIPDDYPPAGNNNGPPDQIRIHGHHADRFAPRGAFFPELLLAVGLAPGIQKLLMVAGSDEILQFRRRKFVLHEIADIQAIAAFFKESLGLLAGGAVRLFQEVESSGALSFGAGGLARRLLCRLVFGHDGYAHVVRVPQSVVALRLEIPACKVDRTAKLLQEDESGVAPTVECLEATLEMLATD